MSTILDALKKVEEEQDTAFDAGQQRQLNALQSTSGSGQLWQIPKLIKWGAMALVICVLTGITFYLFKPDRKTPTQPITEQARAKTQAQPRPAMTRETPPPKPVPITKKRAPIDLPRIDRSLIDGKQKSNSKPAKSAADAEESASSIRSTQRSQQASQADTENRAPEKQNPAQTPPVASAPNPSSQPAPTPPVAQPAPEKIPVSPPPVAKTKPQRKPTPPARRSAPSPKKQTPSESNPYSSASRLTDGSLKVQAIAWSEYPEERMAVINSKIVREGGNVDDYDVVAINPDEVVVRKGGQTYRAIFGRP